MRISIIRLPLSHCNLGNWILFLLFLEGVNSFTLNCKKIPQFLEKPPLSEAKKHPDFQVTLCLQNVTTNADFAYIKSE
jgi:hypothetical protein